MNLEETHDSMKEKYTNHNNTKTISPNTKVDITNGTIWDTVKKERSELIMHVLYDDVKMVKIIPLLCIYKWRSIGKTFQVVRLWSKLSLTYA